MMLKIVEEVTDWRVPYRQPNHVYLMAGEKIVAYSKWGRGQPEYFAEPRRLDRRGRKFIEVKKNKWKFDLSVTLEPEPVAKPQGRIWTVSGSKGGEYTVSFDQGRWACTCPGHGFRGRCRHVDEMKASNPPLE